MTCEICVMNRHAAVLAVGAGINAILSARARACLPGANVHANTEYELPDLRCEHLLPDTVTAPES
jgi:hypothetical protein